MRGESVHSQLRDSAGAGGEVSGLVQMVETIPETKMLNPRAGNTQRNGGEQGGMSEK